MKKIGKHELYLGDCLLKMKHLEDNSVDMVLCDLPYGTTNCDFEKVLKNNKKYSAASIIDLEKLWKSYKRILKPSGVVVLFGAQPFTTQLVLSNTPWYKYSWVWLKNKAANHVAVKFQPLKVHEDVLVFTDCGVNTGASKPILYNPQGVVWKRQTRTRKSDVTKSGSFKYNSLKAGTYAVAGSNYPRSIIEFSIPSGKDRVHPTQKPVDLLEYLIRTYTNKGMVVLDNTMGSGSTGVACVNTGRKFVGIEKDDGYFQISVTRIREARKLKRLQRKTLKRKKK